MGNIEILYCDNHTLKYHNYCKHHNIHLVGYKSVVTLKSQAYGKLLYQCQEIMMLFRVYTLQLICMILIITS